MRIAIALAGPFLANGVCRVAESWARVLAGGGHEVLLVCESGDDPPPEIPGCRVVTHPRIGAEGRRTRLARLQQEIVAAVAALHREAPLDLHVCHEWYAATAIRSAFPQARIAQTIHSPFVDENRLNNWKYAESPLRRLSYPATRAVAGRVERRGLRAIDAAHTLSRYTWSRLQALYPRLCRAIPWRRIPGTFDDRRFELPADRKRTREALSLPASGRILLSVRRLVPRNGVDRIVACARRLRDHPEAPLFLIGGTGPLEARIRAEVERDGLGERVRLLGFVSEAELPAYYQAADAFLLPTRDLECFGLPVVEAMACGCTPLVIPEGGPPELVDDARCIAASNSTEAFVALVTRLLEGAIPPRPHVLARIAREHYSESAVAGEILAFVESAASR